MKRKHKLFLKANVMSLFFIAVSFISGTLAWFAYSGLSDVATEIDIRAWNIDIDRKDKDSNNIVIPLTEISPGMTTQSEVININNNGDTDALVKYSIVSARILDKDNYVASDELTTEQIQDELSNNYPFHININLSKGYVMSKGGKSQLQVSVSWPFDSGNDENDSIWGSYAYNYLNDKELSKKPPIEIVLKLSAEQYMETGDGSDPDYNMGDVILYDISQDKVCYQLSNTCLKTFVIDGDNQKKDDKVRLVPYFTNSMQQSTFNNYTTTYNSIINGWTSTTRPLEATDILYSISKDVNNSFYIVPTLSDRILGYMSYGTRATIEINKAISSNGFYQYKISKNDEDDETIRFPYLSADTCVWTNTNYNEEKGFGIQNDQNNKGRLYGIPKNEQCKVIPVIIANKKKN